MGLGEEAGIGRKADLLRVGESEAEMRTELASSRRQRKEKKKGDQWVEDVVIVGGKHKHCGQEFSFCVSARRAHLQRQCFVRHLGRV